MGIFNWFKCSKPSKSSITICCPICRMQCYGKPRILFGIDMKECLICLEEKPKKIASLSCGFYLW